MTLSRQEVILTSGRRNQKLRTRRALIDAAREIAREGRTLTIAEVADAAQVSVATAYRYFTSPDELVLETTIDPVKDAAALPDNTADRLDAVVRRVTDVQFADEALWRAVLKATLERWFKQAQLGTDAQVPIRSEFRMEITSQALDPVRDQLSPRALRRLTMAIMLVYGMEAMVSARDACGLDRDEAQDVMRWAAQALLEQALDEARE